MGQRRKHKAHTNPGRARAIGPVLGLGVTTEGVENPIHEVGVYSRTEIDWDGDPIKIGTRLEHKKKELQAKLIAIVACGIDRKQVSELLSLTTAQRRHANIHPHGEVAFDAMDTATTGQRWDELASPGQLLIIRGFLHKNIRQPGAASFDFQHPEWDIIDPVSLQNGSQPARVGGLVIPNPIPAV